MYLLKEVAELTHRGRQEREIVRNGPGHHMEGSGAGRRPAPALESPGERDMSECINDCVTEQDLAACHNESQTYETCS